MPQLSLVFVLAAVTTAGGDVAEVEDLLRSGRPDLALAAVEAAVAPERVPPIAPEDALRLEHLRARCFFELSDFPRAERALRVLLDRSGEHGDRADLLGRLAAVLSAQGAAEEALATIDKALGRESPAVQRTALRRLAVKVAVQHRRFQQALPHAEALVASSNPEDAAFGRFGRGICRSREGRHTEALGDLEQGIRVPGAERDARFELALALGACGRPRDALEQLCEVLSADPYDAEACYQASRQLVHAGGKRAAAAAAQLMKYFEALQEAWGPSSRAEHLQAAGKAAEAALARAARWERLGCYERAVPACREAEALARGTSAVLAACGEFWLRLGLVDEARRRLAQARASGAVTTGAPWESLQDGIDAAIRHADEEALGDLSRARAQLAKTRWEDSRSALADLLAAARKESQAASADRAARLLLAVDPNSKSALRHLVERTQSPALLVPRLHYLTRLQALEPGEPLWEREWLAARREFLSEEPTRQP
jgi:tetratricopeptide (TPR) repeat protein